VGRPRLGRLVALRRAAHPACPRGGLPRVPRPRRRRRGGRRRGVAGQRLPRVPWRGRHRPRLARARTPSARPAARVGGARLAGAQRGLVRAQRRRCPRGGRTAGPPRRPARARAGRRGSRGGRAGAGGHRRGRLRPRRGGHAQPRRGVGDRVRGGVAAAGLARLGAVLPDRGLRRRRRPPAGDAVVQGDARRRRTLERADADRRLPQHLRARAGHQWRLGARRGRAGRGPLRPRGRPARPGLRRPGAAG